MSEQNLKQHLAEFLKLKSKLSAFEFDDFGFSLSSENNLDLLITGLTHGDEVIGIEIINTILKSYLIQKPNQKIGFLLNNVNAYMQNARYVDVDLNRSFAANSEENLEVRRAEQIKKIISLTRPRLILDLHQTIELSEINFAIIPEKTLLINLSHQIAPQIPIVCIAKSDHFSSHGQTFLEYAASLNIPALVYELGQKGFNQQKADSFAKTIVNIDINQLFADNIITNKLTNNYYLIKDKIPRINGLELVPHFKNFQKISKNELLAISKTNKYNSPIEGIILFPRYQNIKEHEQELGYIAELQLKTNINFT